MDAIYLYTEIAVIVIVSPKDQVIMQNLVILYIGISHNLADMMKIFILIHMYAHRGGFHVPHLGET